MKCVTLSTLKSPEGFFLLLKQLPFRNQINKPKNQNDFTREVITKAICLLINCYSTCPVPLQNTNTYKEESNLRTVINQILCFRDKQFSIFSSRILNYKLSPRDRHGEKFQPHQILKTSMKCKLIYLITDVFINLSLKIKGMLSTRSVMEIVPTGK